MDENLSMTYEDDDLHSEFTVRHEAPILLVAERATRKVLTQHILYRVLGSRR